MSAQQHETAWADERAADQTARVSSGQFSVEDEEALGLRLAEMQARDAQREAGRRAADLAAGREPTPFERSLHDPDERAAKLLRTLRRV